MKKRLVSKIVKAFGYFLFSFMVGFFIVMFAHDSPARYAYGILSGWWTALYLCSYLNIGIKDFWYIISLDIAAIAASALINPGFATSIADMVNSFFFLLTPFLINIGLAAIKAWLSKIGASRFIEPG